MQKLAGILFFASLLAMLLLAGCASPPQSSNNSQSYQASLDKCGELKIDGKVTIKMSDCIAKLAIEQKNPEICEKIGTSADFTNQCTSGSISCANEIANNAKAECYLKFAESTSDFSQCGKAANLGYNKYNVYDCYSSIAKKSQSIAPCDSIDDSSYKSICYNGVAIEKKDLSICNQVLVMAPFSANACYAGVAVALKDPTICDKIIQTNQAPTEREDCISAASK